MLPLKHILLLVTIGAFIWDYTQSKGGTENAKNGTDCDCGRSDCRKCSPGGEHNGGGRVIKFRKGKKPSEVIATEEGVSNEDIHEGEHGNAGGGSGDHSDSEPDASAWRREATTLEEGD